jgi:hypothetical protein
VARWGAPRSCAVPWPRGVGGGAQREHVARSCRGGPRGRPFHAAVGGHEDRPYIDGAVRASFTDGASCRNNASSQIVRLPHQLCACHRFPVRNTRAREILGARARCARDVEVRMQSTDVATRSRFACDCSVASAVAPRVRPRSCRQHADGRAETGSHEKSKNNPMQSRAGRARAGARENLKIDPMQSPPGGPREGLHENSKINPMQRVRDMTRGALVREAACKRIRGAAPSPWRSSQTCRHLGPCRFHPHIDRNQNNNLALRAIGRADILRKLR